MNKEYHDFINKNIEHRYLEIYLILCELNRKENIISFSYEDNYLLVRTGENDYYRINMNGGGKKC